METARVVALECLARFFFFLRATKLHIFRKLAERELWYTFKRCWFNYPHRRRRRRGSFSLYIQGLQLDICTFLQKKKRNENSKRIAEIIRAVSKATVLYIRITTKQKSSAHNTRFYTYIPFFFSSSSRLRYRPAAAAPICVCVGPQSHKYNRSTAPAIQGVVEVYKYIAYTQCQVQAHIVKQSSYRLSIWLYI